MMRATRLLPFAVPFLAVAFVTAGDAGKGSKDLKKLEGAWTIVSVQEKGEKEQRPVGDTAVFKGNKVIFSIGDEKETAKFKIDSTKKPGWFDITTGPYKGVGIYKLEGNTLKVCLNQSGKERPTAFKSEKDSPNERLFVLKRGKRE